MYIGNSPIDYKQTQKLLVEGYNPFYGKHKVSFLCPMDITETDLQRYYDSYIDSGINDTFEQYMNDYHSIDVQYLKTY